MRYVIALAEHRSFSRAARALGIAQPPLSRQIAALERELSTQLFERSNHGAFPTAAGEVLCNRARQILQEIDAAAEDTRRAARGQSGVVRLGFISSALPGVLPKVVMSVRGAHPGLRLECRALSSRESTAALLAGEVDVGIRRGSPSGIGAERLTAIPLQQDQVLLLCHRTHPFAGHATVERHQVAGQPLVITSSEDEPDVLTALAPLVELIDPASVTEARDLNTTVGLVACGLGVAFLPSGSRALARPDTRVVELRPALRLPDLTLTLRSDDDSPALGAFLTAVGKVFPGVHAFVLRRCP